MRRVASVKRCLPTGESRYSLRRPLRRVAALGVGGESLPHVGAEVQAVADAFGAQAGGSATDGVRRILDLVPTDLHERTPLVIGSREDVGYVADTMRRLGEG